MQWWIRRSSNPSQARVVNFGSTAAGISTFAFQGADFNGDGSDELAIAYATNATGAVTWVFADAVTGAQFWQVNWGNFNTDYIINPADYTGDGRADIVVWRAGGTSADARQWYIVNGATAQPAANNRTVFGIGGFTNGDISVRGDYDGDGIKNLRFGDRVTLLSTRSQVQTETLLFSNGARSAIFRSEISLLSDKHEFKSRK